MKPGHVPDTTSGVRLYILRHGPAEDRAASGRDFDRALTPSGRDRVRDVARTLGERDEAPHLIFTSPLVRAVQTAEIVATVTQLTDRGGELRVQRELAPEGDTLGLIRASIQKGDKRVMVVGHEPDLGELAARLSHRPFPAGLQKAMVVGLTTPKDDPLSLPMRLRFILDPKTLEWSHGAVDDD
ncbi:MAG TPA: phosphohistidine phosphatase SixA [Polyangiaceae bacterium]